MRPDYRLIAAVVAPLLVVWWVPPWHRSILGDGLPGAIVFCISIAVAEEGIFRGGIQSWLLARASLRTSVIAFSRANWLTSVLFAAAHAWQHPLLLIPGYFAVSLVLGYFRERYNGIRVPIALHAWYNIVLLGVSLVSGSG